MRALVLGLVMLGTVAGVRAQSANEMQSAQPDKRAGETEEQHGRRLLDEMLAALGGDKWMNKKTQYVEGQSAPFFRNEPSGGVSRFVQFRRYAEGGQAEATRTEFVTYRGLIEPGTVRQLAHLWALRQGYEYTFKGRTVLPEKQVTDFYRRQDHSLETVMHHWVKAPGTVVLFVGSGERDRRPVDKVSILTASNDNVTIEIEQGTHLPLQRSFEWRNEQFKDHDLDEEVYGDWKFFEGVGTPMNMTEYHDGDMVAQTFYKKVQYNQPMEPRLFDPNEAKMK